MDYIFKSWHKWYPFNSVSVMIHSSAAKKIFTSSTSVLQFCFILFNSVIKGHRARFMTDILLVIPQLTPSHIFCYTLQCPNKGCKQHSQLSDSGAGAFQHAAFCMVRISQIFSSYPAIVILPCRVKGYSLIDLSPHCICRSAWNVKHGRIGPHESCF